MYFSQQFQLIDVFEVKKAYVKEQVVQEVAGSIAACTKHKVDFKKSFECFNNYRDDEVEQYAVIYLADILSLLVELVFLSRFDVALGSPQL